MSIIKIHNAAFSGGIAITTTMETPKWVVSEEGFITKSTESGFGYVVVGDNDLMAVSAPPANMTTIYRRISGNWVQIQTLPSSVRRSGYRLGFKMAMRGDWLAVSDLSSSGTGSQVTLWQYNRDINQFELRQTITEPMDVTGTGFGSSVAINGNVLVIGRSQGNIYGGVYVYELDEGEWIPASGFLQWHTPSEHRAGANQRIGLSAAVNGTYIFAGGTGDTSGIGAGEVVAFSKVEGEWVPHSRIVPPTTYLDGFGNSVRVSGNTLLVGAPNGNAGEGHSGRVFIYQLGNTIELVDILRVGTDANLPVQDATWNVNDRFGWDVDISANEKIIIVGAQQKTNGSMSNAGAVYVFEKANDEWGHSAMGNSRIFPSVGAAANSRYGFSLCFIGQGMAVGSYGGTSRRVYWYI